MLCFKSAVRIFFYSFLSIYVLTFSACKNKVDVNSIQVDAGFSSYVSAFTSGVVSNRSTIKVVLLEPHPKAQVGQIIEQDLFDFEPSLDGQAYWLDEQTVEFRANEKLPSGETFVVEFALDELMAVSEAYETLKFGFVVISQSLFVDFDGLKTIDKKDFSKQELFGRIRTSDVADPTEIEQCLKAEQDGNELEIVWEHDENGKTHRYTVKDVARGEDESFVELAWDGEAIGADVEDELEVRIPPIGEFTLVQASTQRSPSLHFSLQFSDPVSSSQALTGLVYLQSGRKLRLVVSNNEIKAYPVDKLQSEETIVIEKSIKNSLGTELQEQYRRVVQFNLEKPSVELLGTGVIMPSNGGLNFPFKAINLRAVNMRVVRVFEDNVGQFFQVNQFSDYSELKRVGRIVYDEEIDLASDDPIDYGVWNNFSVDLGEIIKPEPGAIYRVMISFERYQSLYPCSDEYGEAKPMKRAESDWDDNGYYGWNSWYNIDMNWREKDDPCTDSYYAYYDRPIGSNVLASNIGLMAKEAAENQYDIIATDLRTSEPLGSVEIQAYNFQNQLIGESTTSGAGLARFKTKGKPYLMIAKNGQERGYLRVDNGSALSVSLYQVGGVKAKNGLKGYLYGERGVWRPGDTIHLSLMLEDKQKTLPKNHPVVVEFYDPLGKLYDKRVTTKGVNGLYVFKLKTEQDDPTGMWRAKAIVGNSQFRKSLKIETIKPNRIHIDIDAGDDVLKAKGSVKVALNAKWLYGADGSNLKVASELTLDNMKTQFKGFEGYQFDDRSRRFYFDETILAESKTDAAGNANLIFAMSKPDQAPGMLKVKLATKVFESGGDFSQDFMNLKYSPYDSYVGVKMSAGTNWMTALNSEKPQAINIAAVDANGNPITREVDVELYEMSWNWWYENDESEITRYINRSSNNLRKSDRATIKDGKLTYNLTFPEPDWGRYAVRIVDRVSGHSTLQTFYVRYSGWRNRDSGAGDAASMLTIEGSKEEFNVGEEIEVTVPSGGEGRIYVSVEKGDRILDQFWVDAQNRSTTFSFEATEEMAPNVYISAALIQPHGQTENDLPMRMYGLLPVAVNNEKTKLNPLIKAPDELAPEKEFTVKVSEKDGKAMSYTLAIVDEGLLSLTRFRTPNPWPSFYAKEALSVRTWDMYKYVMEAQTGKMTSLLATGGDENLVFKGDEEANRFKPVVKFIGPFALKKGKTAEHTLKLPNYIGAVRIMVVAGQDGAYGKADKEIKVNQPLMVLSTLPRVLGPSEIIRIPVNVITMKDNYKSVKVSIETNDLLLMKETEKTLTFAKAGEQTVYFEAEVARQLGVAKFKVNVSSGTESAYEALELIVRPPNPEITKVKSEMLEADGSWAYNYTAFGIRGTNEATLQVSRIPELDLQKHLGYLIRYPHGCIEQTTSSVFPQLFLGNLLDLEDEQKDKIQTNVTAGLNRLRQFQQSSGGFSYWPGEGRGSASSWGTNYAGHFMIEAEKLGYDLPPGLFDQWLKYQKDAANNWVRDQNKYGRFGNDFTQAYRLYTLALSNNAQIGAMNRLRSDERLSDQSAWRLAAAYAFIGQNDVAMELTQRPYKYESYRDFGYNYGSNLRDLAMALETMTYLQDRSKIQDAITDLSRGLNFGWHSTQTRAYALLALSKVMQGQDGEASFSFDVEINGKSFDFESDLPIATFDVDEKSIMAGDVKVQSNSSAPLFISFVQTGMPIENKEPKVEDDLGLNIKYTDMKGLPIDVSAIKQGKDFKAEITISHPGNRADYLEVALSQIFPSGWQIVNTRVGDEVEVNDPKIDYQDIKDDRVYTYFKLKRGQAKTFTVLLNATFVGKYYMPSVFCAPMYDESIKAQMPGRWVEVVD